VTNFILLVGILIGLAGLAALGLTSFISWLGQNPAVIVAALIGAGIAVYATIKVKGLQDERLVKRYRQRQEHEPTTRTPRATKQTNVKPITAQSNINIDDLCEGLRKYGYQKSEARQAIESVLEDMPDASESDVITAAIHYLSDDRVGV